MILNNIEKSHRLGYRFIVNWKLRNIMRIISFMFFLIMNVHGIYATSSSPAATTLRTDSKKTVMITQIIEHPALTAIRIGAVDELKSQGFDSIQNIEFQYENAQGNMTTAVQIAQKFVSAHPDVVLAISTPSAQTLVAAAKGVFPIVFSAITDPVATHLVASLKQPGADVTGVIDRAPFEEQLEFIKKIIGSPKRIGIIYNSSESNSVIALDIIKVKAQELGFKIIEASATKSSEMSTALSSLMDKVDAVFIPNDNTVASSIDSIVKICENRKIPLFAADTMLVEKGVIAVLGYDYSMIGRQTGVIIARILKGEKARDIAVQIPVDKILYINKTAADKINLPISAEIMTKADKIF